MKKENDHSPDSPTPPPQQPGQEGAQREPLSDAEATSLLDLLAYDKKLEAMTNRELINEVLGSRAADYQCVIALMDRVLPGWQTEFTDEELEAPNTTKERFGPMKMFPAPSPTAGMSGGEPTREDFGERVAVNAALLRLFKGEYRDSGDRHSDSLFVRERVEVLEAESSRLHQALQRAEGNDWVCEIHPEKTWPHDDCPGPGVLRSEQISFLVHQRGKLLQKVREQSSYFSGELLLSANRIKCQDEEVATLRSQLARSEEVRKQLAGALNT